MRDYLRYVFGVLAIVLVVVLLIVGFNLLRKAVNKPTRTVTKKTQTAKKAINLTDSNYQNQPMVYTVHGAINGNEEHFGIRTTVTPQVRRVEILKGYTNTVIKTQETANTQEAYKAFVDALNGAGFAKKKTTENSGKENESCLLGRRYNFQAAPGMSTSMYTWSTSCGVKLGDFGGSRALVEQLFNRQIPEYKAFVRDTRLG